MEDISYALVFKAQTVVLKKSNGAQRLQGKYSMRPTWTGGKILRKKWKWKANRCPHWIEDKINTQVEWMNWNISIQTLPVGFLNHNIFILYKLLNLK